MIFYKFYGRKPHAEIFRLLENCKGVIQDKTWHSEGDVFNHSLQTLRCALRESDDIDLVVAAMLHDVGKQISKCCHERYSVDLLKDHVSPKTLWLVGNHMRFWKYVCGDIKKLKKATDMVNHEWFPELAQICRWDKMARTQDSTPNWEMWQVKIFLDIISNGGSVLKQARTRIKRRM